MFDSKKKNFARFGMASKGAVYSFIGVLTSITAFYGEEQYKGSKGALEYISSLSYGKVLVIILGIGLLGYVFWRMYQTFANPNGVSDDFKGKVKRIAYFISGLFYGFLAYYAFQLLLGGNSGSSSSITGDYKNEIAIVVGIGLLIKAGYDLYRAYSGKFREKVEETEMSAKERSLLINAGKFGHTARGLVFGLMAYLTLKSGFGSANVNTKTDAFGYIQSEYGSEVLIVIAIGLISYGIFMLIQAKYPAATIS